MNARPKPQRLENIIESPVISAIPGRVERDENRVPLLVDIEPRDEMVRLDLVGRRQWWNEQIPERRRIVLAWSSSGTRSNAASATGADSRPDAATRTRTCSGRARVPTSLTSGRGRHRRRDRRRRRNDRGLDLWRGLLRLDRRNSERLWLGHHGRIRSHPHELDALLARAGPVRATAASPRRPGTASADRWLMREIG